MISRSISVSERLLVCSDNILKEFGPRIFTFALMDNKLPPEAPPSDWTAAGVKMVPQVTPEPEVGGKRRQEHMHQLPLRQAAATARAQQEMPQSAFVGVSWDKVGGHWRSFIKHNWEHHNLGWFDGEQEAARAYDTAGGGCGRKARPTVDDPAAVTGCG